MGAGYGLCDARVAGLRCGLRVAWWIVAGDVISLPDRRPMLKAQGVMLKGGRLYEVVLRQAQARQAGTRRRPMGPGISELMMRKVGKSRKIHSRRQFLQIFSGGYSGRGAMIQRPVAGRGCGLLLGEALSHIGPGGFR